MQRSEDWSVRVGSSASFASVGGSASADIANHSTSGTGETDLGSYTIPAKAFANDGDKVVVEAFGDANGGSGSFTINFYANGTLINGISGLTSIYWKVSATLVRRSSSELAVSALIFNNIISSALGVALLTGLDLTSTLVVKVTGQMAVSNVPTEYAFLCDYIPKPS